MKLSGIFLFLALFPINRKGLANIAKIGLFVVSLFCAIFFLINYLIPVFASLVPLEDATVSTAWSNVSGYTYSKSDSSESEGHYAITVANPGNVSVSAYKSGYIINSTDTFAVSGDVQKNLTLTLISSATDATVKGHVTSGGSAVSGVSVTVSWTIGDYSYANSATTDGDGYYEVDAKSGTVNIIASKSDYCSYIEAGATINAGDNTKDISLTYHEPTSTVSGTIKDGSGSGISGASVTVGWVQADPYCSISKSTSSGGGGAYSVSIPAVTGDFSKIVSVSASANTYFSNSTVSYSATPLTVDLILSSIPSEAATVSGYILTESVDSTAPTFSDNSTNSTYSGQPVLHSVLVNDNIALQPGGEYIFGFDNCTGTFANDSAVTFSSTPEWVNVTKVINSTVGCTIRWQVYAKDDEGNWGASSVYTYQTSSEPLSCNDIITSDTTLPDDVIDCAGNGLNIAGSNIVLDCDGHSIVGLENADTIGIYLNNSNNIVKNCNVNNFTYGVYVNNSDSNTFLDNVFTDNGIDVELYYSNNNTFSRNEVNESTNWVAFTLDHSHNNTIENNTIGPGSDDGLYLGNSSYNIIQNNHVMQFAAGFEGVGIFLDHNSTYNTVFNNTVESNLVGIELNDMSDYNNISSNIVYNNSDKGIALLNLLPEFGEKGNSYNTLSDNTVYNNTYGVWFQRSNNSFIISNNVSSNSDSGIVIIELSFYNNLTNNTCNYNTFDGILFNGNNGDVNNTIITNNRANSNGDSGIKLYNSSSNTLSENIFCSNALNDTYLSVDSSNNTGDNTCDKLQDDDSNSITCSISCGESLAPPIAFFFNVPPYPEFYENISGALMIFTGGVNNITGYVNDTDLAYWNVTLLKDGIFNSTICSGDSAVNGSLCTWNTSEICSGECENYTLVLNATDLAGNFNTSQIPSMTIDNIPPVLGNTSELITGDYNYTARVNASDTYLKDVLAYVLNGSDFVSIGWQHLCNETQGENCNRSGSGTFNTTWYKDIYSLDGIAVPTYYGYCFGCDIVPGCFKQNNSVDYDCGCFGNDCPRETKFYLIYNASVENDEKPLIGLGNDEWCDQSGCVVNRSLIENGVSSFRPRLESFNDSAEENPWTFHNASDITVYSIPSVLNKNLTFENANGTYEFMFHANDYTRGQNKIYEPFEVILNVPSGIYAEKLVLNEGFIYIGDTVRYLLNITNTGQSEITNINVSDIYDTGINYTAASIAPDEIDYENRNVTWYNILESNLLPSESVLLYVNFSAILSAPGVSNMANVSFIDQYGSTSIFGVSATTAISQSELAITGLPSSLNYYVINNKNMTFTGGFTTINGYVAMSNLSNWRISLLNFSGMVNNTLCFNTTSVDGIMCWWNTTKYCSGECERYRLILNATDTQGISKTYNVENITIDNTPPSMDNFNLTAVDSGFNIRANITDNYLQRVNVYVLTEENYTAISLVHLCNETQGDSCGRPESGTYNATWYKDIYSINSNSVPVYYQYCAGCRTVPGCFKENNSVDYDCGSSQNKFYLIYNYSVEGNEKPLLGLGRNEWCSGVTCVINASKILNGESKFKPLAERFTSGSESPWSYYDTPEITLYSIPSSDNLNLTLSTANGTYRFMTEAMDYIATQNVMLNLFNTDATAPTIHFVFPTTDSGTSNHNWIEANVTASDSESGLDKIFIYLYNPVRLINSTNSSTSPFFVNFTELPDDTYLLNASANDNAENSDRTETQTIIIDTSSPLVSIISPTSTTYNTGNIVVNISATDLHLDKIWFYNGTGNETYVTPIAKTFSEGPFTLYAYANDTAGNSNSANVIFTVDLTNPVYSNFNVSSTEINSSDTLNIFANWVETNPDKAVLYVNGEPTTTILLTDLVNFTWIPAGGADVEQWFNFSIYANDTSGRYNQTSEIPVFVRDNTGPIVYLLSPQANALTNSSSVTFVYNNSDISIRNCSLYIDDVLNETNSSVVPSTTSIFGPKILSEGAHTWKVECYDDSGNLGTSAVQDFTIDLTLPSYSSVNEMPAQPATYSAEQIYKFNITWTDANGINSTRIVWNGTTYASPRVYNLSDVYLFNISSLPVGTYNYSWYATDNAGNANNTDNFEYTIEKVVSECSLNFDPVSPIGYATPVNVSCSCTNLEASAILLRNGTNITSQKNLFVVLGAGDYNYTCYVTATQNYTSALNQSSYTVETISPILTLSSQSWSATYGTNTNVSCTANTNQVTPRLFRNSEVNANGDYALLGVGTYNYVCNNTATQNYTANTTSNELTIEKADDQLNITLNNHINQNISVAYPTLVNVSGSSFSGTHNIYRNGTEVAETSELLAVGWWEYKINSTGNQNYTENAGSSYFVRVNKTASVVNLLLNSVANNITVNVSQQVNITATLVTGEGFIELYEDDELIGNDTLQITNITSYSVEGIHGFSVISPETQNFSASYKTYYTTVKDVVAPNVTVLQPGNNTYRNSNNVTFSFNATDDASGIANCSLYVDGTLKSTKTDVAINEQNNISAVIGSGSRSWYVKCFDNSSNKNLGQSSTWIVKVDTKSPLTEIIGVSDGMTYYDNVTITLAATDYPVGGSGINKTEYNLTGEWENYSTPINVTTDGIYTIYYRTLDNAVNIESAKSLTFTLDKTYPTNNITNPSDQGNVSGSVNFNVTTDGNCVRFYVDDILKLSDTSEPYTYVWDTSQESDGEHELKATTYDGGCGFGNSNTTTITVYARNTAPTSNITSPANNYLTNASANITGTAVGNEADITSVEVWNGTDWNSATGTTSWNYTFNPGISGTYNIKSKATDALGNIETPDAGINIIFDIDAPTISNLQITPNPAAQNSDVFVSAKVTDVNSIAQVNATLEGTTETLSSSEGNIYTGIFTSPSSDGTYELTLSARDNTGNYESSSAELEVNSTIPIIIISPLNASAMRNGTAVIINVSNSDASYYNLSTDGIIHDFTDSASFTASGAEGDFILFVYANKTSGASSSKTFSYKIDNTNPVVNIFAITTPTNSSIQQINGNVTDDNLNDVIINGAAAILSASNFSRNMSLSEGNNTITVVAFDKAGNNGTSTTSIFLDTHTPTTSHSLSGTAGSNSWYKSNVTVSFTVNDSSLTSGYYTQYDSGSGWTNGTSVVLTSSGTLYYRTIDYAGNREAAKSLTVSIDKISPSVNSLTLSESLPSVNSSVKITANVTDSNLYSVKVQIDSTIYNTSFVSQDIYEYDFIPTEQKTYNVTIIADDVAGNVNDSVVEQFTAAIQQKDIVNSIGNETITRSYSIVGIDIDFVMNATTELNVTVSKFSDEPTNVFVLSNGVEFFYISTSSLENVTWVFVKIYYTHADITGLDESTLKMAWYNQTSDEWVTLSAGNPAWVYDTGVNTGDNYVWANMTHFSIYGITGSAISQPPSTPIINIGPSGGAVSKTTTTSTTQTTITSQTPTATTTITSSTSTTVPQEKLLPVEITYTVSIIIIAVVLVAIFVIFFRRK